VQAEPNKCCEAAWKKIDIWEPEDAPEEIICPDCGQIGRIQMFVRNVDLPGVPEGAVKLDRVSITWHTAPEGEAN
jgi:hypothetical protein